MRSLEQRLPLAELLALVVIALGALIFQVRLPSREATDDDYRAVAHALIEQARPGDAVLLFPWWTEKARLFVPPALPVIGYQGSERDPLEAYPRIWVLAEPDLPGNKTHEFEQAFSPGRQSLGQTRYGRLELRLYANGHYRKTAFSGADALAKARAYVEQPDGSKTECVREGSGFRCPGNLRVAAEWHETLFQPIRCLFMKPPGGAARLVVEWSDVPLSSRLEVLGGMVWFKGWLLGKSVTRAGIEVDGKAIADLSIPAGTEGLQRASGSVAAAGATATLKLWSQADNNDERDLCLNVLSQGEEGRL